jgi:hypothetical protein
LAEPIKERGDWAAAGDLQACLRAWRECAEGGVEDDLFDGFGYGCAGWGEIAGQVEACDLEAVEEESGSTRVDIVGGDALEDLADGGLDGGAIFW